jgi:hypothetical protein
LAELSSSASGDWKVAPTRRLESLRYLAASPASVFGPRRTATVQFTRHSMDIRMAVFKKTTDGWRGISSFAGTDNLKAKVGREGRQSAIITIPAAGHEFRRNRRC